MKISKSQLKKVIQEEISNVINEADGAREKLINKHLTNILGDANDGQPLMVLRKLAASNVQAKFDVTAALLDLFYPELALKPAQLMTMLRGADDARKKELEAASDGVSFQGGPERTTMRGAESAQLGAMARGSDIAKRTRPQTKPSNPLTNT